MARRRGVRVDDGGTPLSAVLPKRPGGRARRSLPGRCGGTGSETGPGRPQTGRTTLWMAARPAYSTDSSAIRAPGLGAWTIMPSPT